MKCLGRQVGLPSVVSTPFAGAHNLFNIGYYGRPVEALSECVFDQGPRCGMVPVDPTVGITQQSLLLFDGDVALQDPSVASLVEFALNKDKGLGMTREPPSLHFVCQQCLTEEVVEVRRPLVGQRVGLYRGILVKLHDFGVGWSQRQVRPRAQGRWCVTGLSQLLVAD